MQMSSNEIVKSYQQATSKKNQVQILSELNGCSRNEILKILIIAGEDITKATTKKQKEYVVNMIYDLLDETEEEVKAAEHKYMAIVECLKQFWQEKQGGKK